MQAGDIFIRADLRGEPQRLLTYWRGFLRESVPPQASVKILRPVRFDRRSYGRDGIYFESIKRTEKKRAELSISEVSLRMNGKEIAEARYLTEVLFDWLSGRSGMPYLRNPLPATSIYLQAEGGLEVLNAIEQFTDPELITAVTVGIAYMQGNPRRPMQRFLPGMSDIRTQIQINEMNYFESLLTDAQAEELRATIKRTADLFRKRLKYRRTLIASRIYEVMGTGMGGIKFYGRSINDELLQSYEYQELVAWLNGQEQEKLRSKERLKVS
jgi:hypothetical protein